MKVKIRDNGHSYTYENMNWIKAENGVLTINYQDENDEECEEFGDVPDYISFGDVPQSKATYKGECMLPTTLFCEKCGITETSPSFGQYYCRYCGAKFKNKPWVYMETKENK